MDTNKAIPLGYIQLETGLKPIAVMNDIFLNWHFEKPEKWEDLRLLVNIFVNDYIARCDNTVAKPISGAIEVHTQYKFFIDAKNKTRNQDFKIIGTELTFVEFQSKANTSPPIEVRATEYFGLGIGHSGGKISNQIWLLAEDVDNVLHGKPYTNYVLIDEITNTIYPKPSGIMFVSLSKLAEEDSSAGELAAFLIGKAIDVEAIKDFNVKNLVKKVKISFGDFKEDKEAMSAMTIQEYWQNDARFEGFEEGILLSAVKLIKKGMDIQDVVNALELTSEQESLLETKLANF